MPNGPGVTPQPPPRLQALENLLVTHTRLAPALETHHTHQDEYFKSLQTTSKPKKEKAKSKKSAGQPGGTINGTVNEMMMKLR